MLLGVIADDFTGAGDIGNTLAKGGLRTAQFLGIPQSDAPGDIEAGVVALKSRSIPAEDAVAQSLAALAWLRAQGCRQIVFKYCSTFDSTPEGNIGPVGEALAAELGVKGVIACPVFPTVGRTLYQGHLFVHDRLLNESGLENHPVNPMTDANLVRWLARQCETPVGLVAAPVVHAGSERTGAALAAAAERGETLVIVDAISDADLLTIGRAVADAPLITGGSGIALGLPENFFAAGLAERSDPETVAVCGPEAILAGSCSTATRAQIAAHARSHATFPIDPEGVMSGAVTAQETAVTLVAHTGRSPLAYTSGEPEVVRAVQAKYGAATVSAALDGFFGDVAKLLVEYGIRRLVVAGGETSGAVVSALDLGALTIGPEIDPGVPAMAAVGGEPLGLALKSGNFGGEDFFAKALRMLEGQSHG